MFCSLYLVEMAISPCSSVLCFSYWDCFWCTSKTKHYSNNVHWLYFSFFKSGIITAQWGLVSRLQLLLKTYKAYCNTVNMHGRQQRLNMNSYRRWERNVTVLTAPSAWRHPLKLKQTFLWTVESVCFCHIMSRDFSIKAVQYSTFQYKHTQFRVQPSRRQCKDKAGTST